MDQYFIKVISYKDIELELRPPPLCRLLTISNPYDINNYYVCLNNVRIKNKNIDLFIDSNSSAKKLLEDLPVSITSDIMLYYKNYITDLLDLNFLSSYQESGKAFLGIQLALEAVIYYTKLFNYINVTHYIDSLNENNCIH